MMGSPENEVQRLNNESPQHQVTLQPFYMSKYPITQNQYQAIMGENPSNFKGGNRPVEKVTWHNATEFCQRLCEKTGKIYRLPSESQWEYACRAGTTTPFYFGETITSELVNYNGNYIYGKAPKDKYRGETTNVGSFPPNSFGLYDMHGNVWEWCLDIWHINYDGAPNDGSAWETTGNSNIKVLRGGSWSNSSWNCRSARRYDNYSNNLIYYKGFRIVWYTPEVTNSLDKMIVGKTNKIFQNPGEISSLINQTYPTEKKLTPPPQISQKLTAPPVINQTSTPETFPELIPESEIGEIFTFEVVTVNNFGKIITRTPGNARQKIEDLGNGIKLEMVYIPGGSFMMGSPENEVQRLNNESPQHQVTLQPFYMSKYPITQNQYQAIMGENPSNFKGGNHPVEKVTWHNATEFCQRLCEKTGKIYRLPSESQWEYACRAGTTTPFYFGETITSELVNYNGNYIYGKAPKSNYRQETTNVGIFPPNAFGLYDMHGNVWEWCLDTWHDNYNGAPNDGSVWERGESINQRIIRGGSWNNNPNHCRSAFRFNNYIDNCIMNFGFRVLLLPDFQKKFQNTGEISSVMNQTYPTEKKLTLPPQKSQKLTAPPVINQTSTPETFPELIPEAERGERFTFEVVTVNNFGKIINRTPVSARQKIEDLGNGIKLEMVYIPGGNFLMGSPENEQGRSSDESPQHQVTLQPFYMSKYPITQEQYQAITRENPSHFKGKSRPVENVKWHEAVEFCQKLSEKTGKIYRLPSESQWEYACRAGTTTPFYFGETITSELVNYNGNYPYSNAPKDKYRRETTEVGSFPPNAFGLYDMHGNVWEWCLDIWHNNYDDAPHDGSAWESGRYSFRRVFRGGSWLKRSRSCRSAWRSYYYSVEFGISVGFRIVWYTPEVTNSLDKMIVGKTNKKFQNPGEISSLINQTYPTEKKLTIPPQKSQKLTAPPIINETSPPQKILTSIPEAERGEIFTFEVVTVNNFGKIITRTSGNARQKIEDLGNGIKLEMVYIPGGNFMMGSLENEQGRSSDESPQHQVTLQPFYMSKYPITQEQYQAITRENPSHFKGKSRPVENVKWYDAVEFCQKLSEKTGKIYRLPSESQWEYACRAGTTTPFYFGETITSELVNYDGNYPYSNVPKDKYRGETTNVGSFPPNSFGLYDMHGNVWEWCLDIWHINYDSAPNDGSAWQTRGDSNIKVLRGGSWYNYSWNCRSAKRYNNDGNNLIYYRGFRIVSSTLEVRNSLDKMIVGKTNKRFQNPGEISSLINQTYPTEKKLTPPPQKSQKLTAPLVINETSPPETFPESIPESEIGERFTFEVVTINNFGKIINRTPGNARQKIEDLGNGIKLEMVYIPGGSFLMGSPENEAERLNSESPQHQVTLQPFYISKYPITQNQYQAIMGENPSHFKGGNHPVEKVTWHNATEFCQRLSEKTGKIYRLPSESQWEYACRAGTTTPFYFGETITSELGNYNGNYIYGKAPKSKHLEKTTEVGIFPPNAFGLHDMHGNVWEWCQDVWRNNYNGAPTDGSAWESEGDSSQRLLRGGCWNIHPRFCRSARRIRNNADYYGSYWGFRLLLLPDFQQKFQNTGEISSVINETSPPQKFLTSIPESKIGEIFTFEVVTVNNSGKIINGTPGNARQKIEDLGNGIKLEMVYIPGGSFIMGSPENELHRYDAESPQHQVTLKPFYMSKYPITQNQYLAIMGKNPSDFKGENCPVERVTWHNAKEFCQKLSEKTGRIYRLPSESQWEYACRAGTTTPFYFGETITSELANYNGNYAYGKAPQSKYRQKTTEVGIFPPNAFGLYDMHGNVWEWCLDIWHINYDGAPTDGSTWESQGSSNKRVLRGGCWCNLTRSCRSACRHSFYSYERNSRGGFRIVCLPSF
ncbi:formylglycine-generating enzyme family protein [Okeania sp. SIO3B5]|uniref:formylglycine-generating enzyme family protein n=1 Tax=Okeania sp. SIO3B5 TaxID=2607811 RepID=UPI0035C8E5D2